jgi:WD40 repeat protein
VLVSPDGSTYAKANPGGPVEVKDVNTGVIRAGIHKLHIEVCTVCYSPDGKWLAAGGWKDGWALCRISDGTTRMTLIGGNRTPLAFSPDGRFIAVARTREPMPEPAIVKRLPTLAQNLLLQASPPWTAPPVHEIVIWEVATGTPRALLRGHQDGVTGLKFSPDGKTLASVDFGSVLKLWSSPDGNW